MPTELFDDIGIHIAKKGGEVGATTGRPRRCGWFDAVAMKRLFNLIALKAFVLQNLMFLMEWKVLKFGKL